MKPPTDSVSLVRLSAAWRERALRGSRRFAPACPFFGDATFPPPPDPHRRPFTGHRPLEIRPNRLRFTCQTSEARTCRRFFRTVERRDAVRLTTLPYGRAENTKRIVGVLAARSVQSFGD